jgi:HSP20 family molecular chaperone IbpA
MTQGNPLTALRPIRESELDEHRIMPPSGTALLAYDVYRVGGELTIEFDAPGVDPSDISLTVEGRSLVVSLRRGVKKGPGIDVVEAGRHHGTFQQRLWLGDGWDLDGLQARAENGVLVVRAPVAEVIRRQVDVASDVRASRSSAELSQWGAEAQPNAVVKGAEVHDAA